MFKGSRVELKEASPILPDSFNDTRRQDYSTAVLKSLSTLKTKTDLDRILGVTNADPYKPSSNFVFGETECPGNVALISLFRLDPESYGRKDELLFSQHTLKEAAHELGHTFCLGHCASSNRAMFFSNSIYDTDRKQERLC